MIEWFYLLGCALAIKTMKPDVMVIGVEPGKY